MMTTEQIDWNDATLPFQLDETGIRGRVARLDGVLDGVLQQHNYPPQVEALVAEMALLTALIGQTIKLRWKMSLQVQSKGAVRMIATDYFAPETEGAPARIRAYASFDADRLTEGAPISQVGEGYFAILIDQGKGTAPYQGITPLNGESLSSCAEAYFAQSEQLPTEFTLSFGRSTEAGGAEHWRAGGIMIQHMPKTGEHVRESGQTLSEVVEALPEEIQENWTRTSILMRSVEEMELIGPAVSPQQLLVRLFHEEQPRVFPPQRVAFGCTCSEERVRQSLSIYSARDIEKMTTEDGKVTADCQFCGAHYVLDPTTVGFEAPRDA